MGGFFEYSCDRCDFRRIEHEGNLYVVCADGSEVLCGHPAEVSEAERETGCNWSELERDDRLRGRRAYLCLHCGETAFYGQHGGKWECVTKIRVSAGEVQRSDSLQCVFCSCESLHEMGKRTGSDCSCCILPPLAMLGTVTGLVPWWSIVVAILVGWLIFWLSTRRKDLLICPICKIGHLKCEVPMIS